jgi:hypothetical protein
MSDGNHSPLIRRDKRDLDPARLREASELNNALDFISSRE